MLGPLSGLTAESFACDRPVTDGVQATRYEDAADARHDARSAIRAAAAFDGFAVLASIAARQGTAQRTAECRVRLMSIVLDDGEPYAPGERVPYLRAYPDISVRDAATIWTLTDEKQRLSFGMLAEVVRQELAGISVPPVRMVITGKPGTGKSRVLQALQWFTLQLGAVDMLAVVAYTWRAALLLGTPDNPACTTSTFFAINSFDGDDGLRASGKVRVDGSGRNTDYPIPVRTRRCVSVFVGVAAPPSPPPPSGSTDPAQSFVHSSYRSLGRLPCGSSARVPGCGSYS
jgi:hypothetical protein